MRVRLCLFLLVSGGIFVLSAQVDSGVANENGSLSIKAYPPTAIILLNDVKLGTNSLTVENLKPGYYRVTCHNKSRVTEKIIKVYPGVTSDVYLSADIPEMEGSLGVVSVIDNKLNAFGPSIELGRRMEHHYVAFSYYLSTYSTSTKTSSAGPFTYVDWINYYTPDTISGVLESNQAVSESFYGGGITYLYEDYFSLRRIEFDPGLMVGFFRHRKIIDYSSRFQDSTGSWRTFAAPQDHGHTDDCFVGPTVRGYVKLGSIGIALEYAYLVGNSESQLSGASIECHL